MKKELKNKLFFISGVVFAFALLGGAVVVAQAVTNSWTPPTQNFPQANVYPPIDSGPDMPSTNNPRGFAVREGRIELGGRVWNDAQRKSIFQPGVSLILQDQSSIGNSFSSFTPSISGMTQIFSQGNLLINSTGLVLPRTATGAPSNTPVEGTIYYKTADKKVQLWNGTAWTDLGGGGTVGTTTEQSMKICRVYVPNNWSDTINVPTTWTANSCNLYAGLQKATRYVLGCFEGDGYRFGSEGLVGNYPVSANFPNPDCGWKISSGAYFSTNEQKFNYTKDDETKWKMFCDTSNETADCVRPIIYPTKDQIKQQEAIVGFSLTSVTKPIIDVFCKGYGGGNEDCTEYGYYSYTFNP